MNLKYYLSSIRIMGLIFFFVLALIIIVSSANAGYNWTIQGNEVYNDSSKAYIGCSPHTITSSGWITCNITSKQYTGNIDMAFGVDDTAIKPRRAELKTGGAWSNIVGSFSPLSWNYDGFNKWYYAQNIPIVAGTQYSIRVWLELKPYKAGKYSVALKPSSQTLEQAKNAGDLFYLDPWYSPELSYRIDANVTNMSILSFNASNLTGTNNATHVFLTGKANAMFSNVNISYDNTTALPWCNERTNGTCFNYENQAMTSSNGWVQFWVNVSYAQVMGQPLNQRVNIYYGNDSYIGTPNAENVFMVSDDFNRSNSSTVGNGWTEYDATEWGIWNNELTKKKGSSLPIYHTLYRDITTGIIIEAQYNIATNYQAGFWWNIDSATDVGYKCTADVRDAVASTCLTYTDISASAYGAIGAANGSFHPPKTWHNMRLSYSQKRGGFWNWTYQSHTVGSDTTTLSNFSTVGLDAYGDDSTNITIDNFRVRDYWNGSFMNWSVGILNPKEPIIDPILTNGSITETSFILYVNNTQDTYNYFYWQYKENSSSTWVYSGNTSTNTTSISGLTPLTVYDARVRVSDVYGNYSNWSNIEVITTSGDPEHQALMAKLDTIIAKQIEQDTKIDEAGTIGFIGGIIGACIAIGVLRRRR